MANPFDLPRSDCAFSPTVETITLPMLPKPLWAGAVSYEDPNYPSGGGPNDVPPAAPSIGQALPADMTPPAQTSMGGGGDGGDIKLVQAQEDGSYGTVSVKEVRFKQDVSAQPNYETTGNAYNIKYIRD